MEGCDHDKVYIGAAAYDEHWKAAHSRKALAASRVKAEKEPKTHNLRMTQKELHATWNALAKAEKGNVGTDLTRSSIRSRIVEALDVLHSNEDGCDVCDMEELLLTPWETVKKAHEGRG